MKCSSSWFKAALISICDIITEASSSFFERDVSRSSSSPHLCRYSCSLYIKLFSRRRSSVCVTRRDRRLLEPEAAGRVWVTQIFSTLGQILTVTKGFVAASFRRFVFAWKLSSGSLTPVPLIGQDSRNIESRTI